MKRTIGIYAYSKSARDTVGGVEAQVTHLAHTLAERDFNVVIHCLAAEDVGLSFGEDGITFQSEVTQQGEHIKVFKPTHGPGFKGAIEENIRVSKENNEELILCIGTRDGYVFDLAIAASKELSIPLVSFIYFTFEERWFRSHFSSRTRSIPGLASLDEKKDFYTKGEDVVSRVVEGSDLVIVPTHYVRAQVLAISGIEKAGKVRICYHGANEAIFGAVSQPWSSSGDILNVARLNVPYACDKGFLWALDFYAKRHRDIQAPKLQFCGAGNGQKVIGDYISAHKLEGKIEVAGFLDQRQLAEKYSKASYLLIPSMMEAGCTVVVEAAMAGCLPVALDSAGLAEIMESIGLEDFLVPGKLQRLSDTLVVLVPEEDAMVALFKYCESHEKQVTEKLAAAQEISKQKYSVTATTTKLFEMLAAHKLFYIS
ncbi:MAG: glycosyltransferase [Bacteroidetes bacterium]|nr:glycosyltransferase [Bacteroidota bacterium]